MIWLNLTHREKSSPMRLQIPPMRLHKWSGNVEKNQVFGGWRRSLKCHFLWLSSSKFIIMPVLIITQKELSFASATCKSITQFCDNNYQWFRFFARLSANNEHAIFHNAHNNPMMLLCMRKPRQRPYVTCPASCSSKQWNWGAWLQTLFKQRAVLHYLPTLVDLNIDSSVYYSKNSSSFNLIDPSRFI